MRLALKLRLIHHMTGKHDPVVFAPGAHIIGKCICKTLGNMIVVAVTGYRNTVLNLKEQLRQLVQYAFAVFRLICNVKIGGIWYAYVHLVGGVVQCALSGKLRFVGKYSGNIAAEIIADLFLIALMCDFYKLVDSLF